MEHRGQLNYQRILGPISSIPWALLGSWPHSASQTSLSSMSMLSRVATDSGIPSIEGSSVVLGLNTERN